ncbi:MAG: dipeptidase PepE [Pirellulaceae bacterium]
MKRLLLISSSRTHGTGFLEHCADAIQQHLQDVSRVLFIPYALANRDSYARLTRKALGDLGFEVESLHEADNPVSAIENAEAIFTGGGNTFRLVKTLYKNQLIEPIRNKVLAGTPYMGSSAGTNITCPTICTTNDMPIVEPPSFNALNLIPFQINPHFIDANPDSEHQGETRETRLREYLEENTTPVLGIREGCWLNISDTTGTVGGSHGAVLFCRDQPSREMQTGDSLQELLNPVPA